MTDAAEDRVPGTDAEPGAVPPAPDEVPSRPTVAQAAADFVQMSVDYVRQETEGVMRDKVVQPGQKLGQVFAFAIAAALVLFLGVGYLSVAALMVLASFVGWPAALAIVGGVLIVVAAILTALKMRSIQK